MKSLLLTAAVVMAVSGFAAAAHAAAMTPEEFVHNASIGGNFEIETSKLALKKSTSTEVKTFAQKMIDDHTKADKELKATLKEAKVAPVTADKVLDDKHQKILDDLKQTKTEDFDKEYIKDQKDAHDEAIALFKDYSQNGDNAPLKAFATKTLPTLQMHHDKVDNLKSKM